METRGEEEEEESKSGRAVVGTLVRGRVRRMRRRMQGRNRTKERRRH